MKSTQGITNKNSTNMIPLVARLMLVGAENVFETYSEGEDHVN